MTYTGGVEIRLPNNVRCGRMTECFRIIKNWGRSVPTLSLLEDDSVILS